MGRVLGFRSFAGNVASLFQTPCRMYGRMGIVNIKTRTSAIYLLLTRHFPVRRY